MLGVALSTPTPRPEAYFGLVADGDRVVAAGLRTSNRLIVSREGQPGAMAMLAADACDRNTEAVLGPVASVTAFIEASGAKWKKGMEQRIYELREVERLTPTLGAHRLAGPDDRAVLTDWVSSFFQEATSEPFSREAIQRVNDQLIADGALHVWEDQGRLVACTAAVGPTPHGIRLNRVYTPPELRGRGYATALVAAVCRYLLEGGRRFVLLHTDLANPTSNRLYMRIGFRPVGDATDFIREM